MPNSSMGRSSGFLVGIIDKLDHADRRPKPRFAFVAPSAAYALANINTRSYGLHFRSEQEIERDKISFLGRRWVRMLNGSGYCALGADWGPDRRDWIDGQEDAIDEDSVALFVYTLTDHRRA
jgi:hypothetical protein